MLGLIKKDVPLKDVQIIPFGDRLILRYRNVSITSSHKNGFEPYRELQREINSQACR